MRLLVYAFGKLKAPGLREAADYYQKLLRTWVPVEAVELKPVPVPDKSPATRSKIQSKETELLDSKFASQLSPRAEIYLLDEGGRALTTQQWAQLVREIESRGAPEVAFCVGSSLGFSDDLRRRSRSVLSLGPQTLPHELARVVLFEQLYRAWSVTRGHPYHNEG